MNLNINKLISESEELFYSEQFPFAAHGESVVQTVLLEGKTYEFKISMTLVDNINE